MQPAYCVEKRLRVKGSRGKPPFGSFLDKPARNSIGVGVFPQARDYYIQSKEKIKMKSKDFNFELFGSIWKVKFIDNVKDNGDGTCQLGNTNSMNQTITISTKDMEGNSLSEDTVTMTLYHELVHCIFDTGAYMDCTDNEPLVEWTARCINSLLKQKVFEYAK